MGTGSLLGIKREGRDVDHPVPTIPLLPVWSFVACSRASFTFYHKGFLKGNINVPKLWLVFILCVFVLLTLNLLAVEEIIFIYDYFRWNLYGADVLYGADAY